ncbi:hypothetical protein ACKWTF_007073 [Chironomus riparius]
MIANFSVVRNEKRLKIPIKIIKFSFFSIKSSSFELWYFKKTIARRKKEKKASRKKENKNKKGAKKSRKRKNNRIKLLRWEKKSSGRLKGVQIELLCIKT